jgi:cytochrome c biogenesis protein CcmG/thiol:disulfide interchange protein DsbE
MKSIPLRRTLLPLLCIALALFAIQCSRTRKTGPEAQDFTLRTLDNQEVTLSALRGKVVLLDFWATWCGPCRESIPHLVDLYRSYREEGIEVVGMNLDTGGEEGVRRFVQAMAIPYPIVLTPGELARKYGVTGIPSLFLIDKQGKIRERFVGFSPSMMKQAESALKGLLAEP